jgi:hypothetical protein
MDKVEELRDVYRLFLGNLLKNVRLEDREVDNVLILKWSLG